MRADGSLSRRLHVQVVDSTGRSVPARGLARWLEQLAPRQAAGSLTVAIVSDQASRALNRSYRGIDRATDVLSFPAGPLPVRTSAQHGSGLMAHGPGRSERRTSTHSRTAHPRTAHPRTSTHSRTAHPRTTHSRTFAPSAHLGDVVIARGVARRQALSAGHAETTEWRVLALHGLLHLIGYDHERDAGRMGRAERRLRRAGGLETGLIERESRR